MAEKNQKTYKNIVLGICVLLVGLLVAVCLDPTKGQYDYESCKTQAVEIRDNVASHIVDEIKTKLPTQAEDGQSTENNKQKYLENIIACNDLHAQISMSRVTHWGLFIGVLGLLSIVATLWQTQKAVVSAADTLEQAKIATQAAQSGVQVTREIGEKQARAYVGIDSINMIYAPPSMILEIVLKNYGASPVVRGAISGKLDLFLRPIEPISGPEDELEMSIPYLGEAPFSVIEVGGTTKCSVNVDHSMFMFEPPTRLLEQIMNPRTTRWFRLNVNWFDVFGGKQSFYATASDTVAYGHEIIRHHGTEVELHTNIHRYNSN